jgi:hypothetical protein
MKKKSRATPSLALPLAAFLAGLVGSVCSADELFPPVGVVRRLVHYYQYFGVGDVCHEVDRDNVTHISFLNYLDRCARPNYMPTILSAKQIGWKKSSQPVTKKRKFGGSNTSGLVNDSVLSKLNITEVSQKQSVEKTSYEVVGNNTEIVHAHLAFALVLPGHPYSAAMVSSLQTIAPMYPTVNIVIGDGNEFKELYAQYGVRSFPRLFLFTKGISLLSSANLHCGPVHKSYSLILQAM